MVEGVNYAKRIFRWLCYKNGKPDILFLLLIAMATATVPYVLAEYKNNRLRARNEPMVWRVRTQLGGQIISEFYSTNPHPVEISVKWTTNVTADGIVITSEIKTNILNRCKTQR